MEKTRVLEWGSLSDVFRTDEYPDSFMIEAESLAEAIDTASIFPLDKRSSPSIRCHCAFEKNNTKPIDGRVVTEERTKTAAFILTCEIPVVSGIMGREAIFAVKREGHSNSWIVRCVKIVKIKSGQPITKLAIDKISDGILHYTATLENETSRPITFLI